MQFLPLVAVACFGVFAAAQQGDRPNDPQTPLPDDLVVPPAIVRSPAEELATFRLPPGFAAELVASEPLVGDPIAATFDAAFRLWVVEMRGFMNDVDATGEAAPTGRIVVLHDRDRDGRMDDSTVFLEGLVLPRAVLPLRGGALVIEPPNLLWCPDRDLDLRADSKEVVMGGFEAGLENPEHSGNGLLWGLDHRVHLANDQRMLRWSASGFSVEKGAGGGQWGITHDDRGRLYFNYNEDWLRCDLVPGRYGPRAANQGGLPGLNHRLLKDTSVWPIRITPGVNRGYQRGRLVDHRLAIQTAVCGPHVLRSELLPGCDGNAFVCEPAGNVVRRIELRDPDGLMTGANVYQPQRAEFLASTDERFRPVNLFGGPDGALYVVDLYRGVIQHKNFVTTFLRRQILQRNLERPIGLGRIWRIVPADRASPALAPAPSLQDAPVGDLVAAMAQSNGTRRDLALRELVQRQERSAAPALRAALREHARPGCRIGLLSALAGLGELTATDLRFAMHDRDPGVVAFALQHSGTFLGAGDGLLWTQLELRAVDGPPAVAWQAALTIGEVLDRPLPAARRTRALEVLATLAHRPADDPLLAGLIAGAVGGQALDLVHLLNRQTAASPATSALLRELARVVVRRREESELQALFRQLEQCPQPWQQLALLQGAVQALPKAAARVGFLSLSATPSSLSGLVRAGQPDTAALANELLGSVALRAGAAVEPEVELAPEERQRVVAGQKVFAAACAACHQLDGNGMAGLAPPLRESEWVAGDPARAVRIVLHGLRGPVEVAGTTWTLEMPGQRHLADADLAAALSYVRRSFGNRGTLVTPAEVGAVREATKARQEPWTVEELLGTK